MGLILEVIVIPSPCLILTPAAVPIAISSLAKVIVGTLAYGIELFVSNM